MTAITPPELPKFIVNASGRHKYVFTYNPNSALLWYECGRISS